MDIINEYTNISQSDIDSMQETIDRQRRGYHQVTLTEMDSTTIPQVAAGSMVEVGGALYEAASAESISGSASSGTNYIKLVPGTGVVTPTWTTTAPTWSDAKQGWYGTSTSAGHRYIETTVDYDGASSYDLKRFLFVDDNVNILSGHNLQKSFLDAYDSNGGTLTTSLSTIIYDTVNYDFKSEYNNSTGVFTVKSDGAYHIKAGIAPLVGTNDSVTIEIQVNGTAKARNALILYTTATITPVPVANVSKNLYLKRNNQVRIQASYAAVSGTKTYISGEANSYFSIMQGFYK